MHVRCVEPSGGVEAWGPTVEPRSDRDCDLGDGALMYSGQQILFRIFGWCGLWLLILRFGLTLLEYKFL